MILSWEINLQFYGLCRNDRSLKTFWGVNNELCQPSPHSEWFRFLNKWGKWWSYLYTEVKWLLIGSSKNKRQKLPLSNMEEHSVRPPPLILVQERSSIFMSWAIILQKYTQWIFARIWQCNVRRLFPLHTEEIWCLRSKGY